MYVIVYDQCCGHKTYIPGHMTYMHGHMIYLPGHMHGHMAYLPDHMTCDVTCIASTPFPARLCSQIPLVCSSFKSAVSCLLNSWCLRMTLTQLWPFTRFGPLRGPPTSLLRQPSLPTAAQQTQPLEPMLSPKLWICCTCGQTPINLI